MTRVKNLDGIRCIAVLMVLFGHAMPPEVGSLVGPFNFLGRAASGVTLFFVLSGYLITSLFVRAEAQNRKISTVDFYTKRILRLWPALYVYVIFVVIMKVTGMSPMASWGQIASAAFHMWNYSLTILPKTELYENGAAHFMHLWSLSVEEQFYWIYPLIFALLFRRGWLTPVLLFLVCAMPVVRLTSYALFESQRPYVSMLFHTASEPLFIGCLLAVWRGEILGRMGYLSSPAVLPASLIVLLLVSFFAGESLSSYWSLTGGRTIEAVVCAVVVLSAHASEGRGAFSKALSWYPVQLVGLSSYSIYLWQNIFTRPNAVFDLPFTLAVVVSLVVGLVSYFFIERPFLLFRQRRFDKSSDEGRGSNA